MNYLLGKLKDYKILYCEDDEAVATVFLSLLNKLTHNVVYAKDGEEGLELYHKENPDIIITDLEMPKKTGLELIKDIRKENPTIPIIISSAYGEQKFLLNAIDLSITKFLLKPITKDALIEGLESVVALLEDKKMATKVRIKMEKKKLRENTKEVINQFLDICVSPIIIVKNNRLTNMNSLFEKLFNEDDLKLLSENINNFNNLVEKKEGFASSLDELDEENYYHNKISIVKPNGKRKIFQVVIKRVFFKGDKEESTIYTFQNITYLEYQKLKIKNYSARLEDFIIKNKYRNFRREKEEEKIETFEEFVVEDNKEERKLDEKEEKLLRKSHIEKISAEEFLESLSDYIIEDIHELVECEEELNIEIEKFEHNPTKEMLDEIIVNMEKYAKAIKNLQEFDELAEAIYSTINLLKDVELNEENILKVQKFIENLFLDLRGWRRTIFENASTQDIHYLDSSLFSSCLQFELELKGEKPEEDEGEFEFF